MPEAHQPKGALERCSLFVLERYAQELGIRRVRRAVAFDGSAPLKKLDDAQQAFPELFLQERVVEDHRWLAGLQAAECPQDLQAHATLALPLQMLKQNVGSFLRLEQDDRVRNAPAHLPGRRRVRERLVERDQSLRPNGHYGLARRSAQIGASQEREQMRQVARVRAPLHRSQGLEAHRRVVTRDELDQSFVKDGPALVPNRARERRLGLRVVGAGPLV